jgi:hypothetical protein
MYQEKLGQSSTKGEFAKYEPYINKNYTESKLLIINRVELMGLKRGG